MSSANRSQTFGGCSAVVIAVRSVLVYRKPTHTDQYLHYSSHHQTSCKKSVISSLFNTAYSIITNKDDLHKENSRIKQVLQENGYQENIIRKIFKRITNNHSLPQSQQNFLHPS